MHDDIRIRNPIDAKEGRIIITAMVLLILAAMTAIARI
jgi:hypothetical protein